MPITVHQLPFVWPENYGQGDAGPDVIKGTEVSDFYVGEDGDDTLLGGGGDDILLGLADDDIAEGSVGSDVADGGSGDDTLNGGAGDDTMFGGIGADRMDGGSGDDILLSEFTINDFDSIQYYYVGDTAASIDSLSGGEGNDFLMVGTGDSADGGEGDRDVLFLDLTTFTEGVDLDFSTMAGGGELIVAGGVLRGFERHYNIYMTEFDDTLDLAGLKPAEQKNGVYTYRMVDGYSGDDAIFGSEGRDMVFGGDGDDFVYGRDGGDYLYGSDGADHIEGGAGTDSLQGHAGDDYLSGGDDRDYIIGDYGSVGSSKDRIDGGSGNDLLFGGADDDLLIGGDGIDAIEGGSGKDRLQGDAGRDVLEGGDGADRLAGGADRDMLTGGAAADIFVFDQAEIGVTSIKLADRITDFTWGERDRIDLTAIDADATTAGDQAFRFIAGAAFSGVAGELRLQVLSTGDTYVYGDTTGDKAHDFVIRLDGAVTITQGSFML